MNRTYGFKVSKLKGYLKYTLDYSKGNIGLK